MLLGALTGMGVEVHREQQISSPEVVTNDSRSIYPQKPLEKVLGLKNTFS